MRAVVLASRNAPVSAGGHRRCMSTIPARWDEKRVDVPVKIASVPLRPSQRSSTSRPARIEPGMPVQLRITYCARRRFVSLSAQPGKRNGKAGRTHVTIGDVKRAIAELRAARLKEHGDEAIVEREREPDERCAKGA